MTQLSFADESEEYKVFVDKFKPKKTTDDCYTPENIYEAIAEWVSKEYGIERSDMVRPFWPGGDYENYEYPEGCCVVDNPPFSMLAKITRFYLSRSIDFFLFTPALTCFTSTGGASTAASVTRLCLNVSITYENGADVSTSFVTNLDAVAVRSCPELYRIINDENKKNLAEIKRQTPKYDYPDEVLSPAHVGKFSKYGIEFSVGREDATYITAMDAQKELNKAIFGGGFLLSERAAAERAAAHKWELSERELKIQKMLG